ncbi:MULTISPECIES: hypothetical protein [unclassified Fusibacter]|uniref:coiled-coil domain-containing protein n=1 Tax=unclassified Fusibacter TaxID=2624464 RepID=UPI0010135E46|nr:MULTISPECIES: hypothetical protein [unclassified Fusibacter]MCK8058492.1 hypothetical protein [Fusibacter sp. A2]NPE22739.1 hypothetical protein [Fusibacter sp. A1]RXV60298.1 hypothetical protein DWB64_12905 [Fusibacter sp. A1]
MDKSTQENVKRGLTPKGKSVLKTFLGIITTLLLTVAWVLIVMYGIDYGKMYIDESIHRIEVKNIENQGELIRQNQKLNEEISSLNREIDHLRTEILELNQEITAYSLDISELKSSIDIVNTSIEDSVVLQSEIANRIQELDNRLLTLRKSLNILLEAP